jgi:hypothetical protein
MRDLHSVNGSLMSLLPKMAEASSLKDYRPISLIHYNGKLISKLLANRLALRLGELVHPGQTAFIKLCYIQDSFKFVQTLARLLHAQKIQCLLLKVDIARAFDSVAWSFLIGIMQFLGFPDGWLNWVAALLSTASTQVLMNGSPGDRIWHGRGLW